LYILERTTLEILLWGLSWFVLAFLSHLLIWGISVPEQPFKILALIFLFFAGNGILFWWLIPQNTEYLFPATWIAVTHAELLYFCLAVSYMFFYQGLKTKSPSINMIMMVDKAGDNGIDGSAFMDVITDDNLIKPRIRFLTQNNMAFISSGKYQLTNKGKLYARSFMLYRRALKLHRYGG
jgi:hypothetical protein